MLSLQPQLQVVSEEDTRADILYPAAALCPKFEPEFPTH